MSLHGEIGLQFTDTSSAQSAGGAVQVGAISVFGDVKGGDFRTADDRNQSAKQTVVPTMAKGDAIGARLPAGLGMSNLGAGGQGGALAGLPGLDSVMPVLLVAGGAILLAMSMRKKR